MRVDEVVLVLVDVTVVAVVTVVVVVVVAVVVVVIVVLVDCDDVLDLHAQNYHCMQLVSIFSIYSNHPVVFGPRAAFHCLLGSRWPWLDQTLS